jgi:hypothetical protein
MSFMLVKWIHDFPDEPVLLYSEIDEERCEVRKVDMFRDGTASYADRNRHTGSTRLGDDPVPSLAEIARQKEFQPQEISAKEFEDVWRWAVSSEKYVGTKKGRL